MCGWFFLAFIFLENGSIDLLKVPRILSVLFAILLLLTGFNLLFHRAPDADLFVGERLIFLVMTMVSWQEFQKQRLTPCQNIDLKHAERWIPTHTKYLIINPTLTNLH